MSVLRDDRGRLGLDLLPVQHDPLEVVFVEGLEVGAGDAAREPHRHDYHELVWVSAGSGRHLLDGRPVEIRPGTLTVIGRGQVHVFEAARAVTGAAIRFGDELLDEGPLARSDPAWLLAGCGGWTVTVPAGERAALEATIRTLAAESAGPLDGRSADLQRHLLAIVLLWIERWYDGQRIESRGAQDADVELYRRFARLLEHDFRSHHDAAHYADALAIPPAALSHALAAVSGRPTKELVTDRVMTEAVRLLRFTDRSVSEIAYDAGFADPLYFSRAFKRHRGEAPTAFRERARGDRP